MSHYTITCEHIISSLKSLGFTIIPINENLVSLHKDSHTIRVSRGALDNNRELRMRRELSPIFLSYQKTIDSSSDPTLLSVRDWLAEPCI